MRRLFTRRSCRVAVVTAVVAGLIPFAQVGPALAAPPALITRSPANRATGVAIDANLEFTFDQTISLDGGHITIRKWTGTDWLTTELIRAQDGLAIASFEPGTFKVIINPRLTFTHATTYAILIDGWYFKNAGGEALPGIESEGTWQFTTVAAPAPSTTTAPTTTVSPTPTVVAPSAVIGTRCPRVGARRTVRSTRLVCRKVPSRATWQRT